MSAINLQGKSTLGAFVKSPLGARSVGGEIHATLQSDGVGRGILTPSTAIQRAALISGGYAWAYFRPWPIQVSSFTTLAESGGQILGKSGRSVPTLDPPGKQYVYTYAAWTGLSFTLPNITGLTSAKLGLYVGSLNTTLESVQIAAAVAAVDDSGNYNNVASNWWGHTDFAGQNQAAIANSNPEINLPLSAINARGSFSNVSIVISTNAILNRSGASCSQFTDAAYFTWLDQGPGATIQPYLALSF